MPRPKWFKSDIDIAVGDVVLFTKHESALSSTYQFGIVDSVELGRDGKIRNVYVRYRNRSEQCNRVTFRSTRSLVIIHRVCLKRISCKNCTKLNENLKPDEPIWWWECNDSVIV